LDFVSGQEFAQIFGGHFRSAGGAAKGETVIIFGDLVIIGLAVAIRFNAQEQGKQS
jgi:hypothetical protein